MNSVSVLKLILHHVVIGYLAGFQNGKNILVFTDAFRRDSQRPALSVLTSPVHPQSEKSWKRPS
jgi:serine/threonine-protein kinase HipA